MPGFSPGWR